MNVPNRLQRFPQGRLEKRGCQPLSFVVQNRDQINSVHIVERHIGGVVLFEDLMHGNDIGMLQRRHAARLAQELLFQGHKLRLGCGRNRTNLAVRALTQTRGKAFLYDDIPFEAVARHISHGKAALLKRLQNLVQPVQKTGAGWQFGGVLPKRDHQIHV